MKTVKRSEILKKLKAKALKETKRNVTFRINEQLLEAFRSDCAQEKLSMNEVVEELLTSYVGFTSKKK